MGTQRNSLGNYAGTCRTCTGPEGCCAYSHRVSKYITPNEVMYMGASMFTIRLCTYAVV